MAGGNLLSATDPVTEGRPSILRPGLDFADGTDAPLFDGIPTARGRHARGLAGAVIEWLKGAGYGSELFAPGSVVDRGADIHLRGPSGQELRIRDLRSDSGTIAVGFRHDLPQDGVLWRSEGVLRFASGPQPLLRTQSMAISPGGGRKPCLVKLLLKQGRGGQDGPFEVSDQPLFLENDKSGLDLAQAVFAGQATQALPVIYVSARDGGGWLLSEDQLSKLAFDLGGVAHVVVEPGREFSFRLRDLCRGRNTYAGAIALLLPDGTVVRRLFPGGDKAVVPTLTGAALALRGQMPACGWDWPDLQEQIIRAQRQRDRKRLSPEDEKKLYLDEIDTLNEKIAQLTSDLAQTRKSQTEMDVRSDKAQGADLAGLLGPEVYDGEIVDRLRYAAGTMLQQADTLGVDARSLEIFRRFCLRVPLSPGYTELRGDLKRATRDAKRIGTDLPDLLERHGYRRKNDKTHITMERCEGYEGLAPVTVSKTPSDHRAPDNHRRQAEGGLGLTRLDVDVKGL